MKRIVTLVVLLALSLSCRSQPTPVDIMPSVPPMDAAPTVPVVETTPSAVVPGNKAAASASKQVFSPQQLEKDFLVLRTTLEEAHPGLYYYVDKATRDAQFESLLQQLKHEMTDIEFYRLITPLVNDIHDGHTVVWPSARSVVYTSDPAGFLPFTLRFINNRAFIENNYSAEVDIAPRMEVLTINGLDMPDIVERLLPYVPQDGYSETARPFLLGQAFPLYHGYVIGPSDTYTLAIRDPSTGEETTTELLPLSPAKLGVILADPSDPIESLSLEVLEDQAIAIMTIRSFSASGISAFFADSFKRLDELDIPDLIIDLRGNGGGDGDHGALLYAYLTDEPFQYYDHLGIVLDGPLTYLEHTNMPATKLESILQHIKTSESGDLHYPHWLGLDRLQQNRPGSFGGNVYFLIDGGCGSSTTEFAAIAHYNKRGPFIGQETNGTYFGNNSGEMPTLTLPNTGVMIVIPLFQFVMAVSDPPYGRGIIPDYTVVRTVEDYVTGIDTELEFALDLIRQNR
jgi:hypothetical protein